MVSPEALARKQRFLDLKEQYDDIAGIIEYTNKLTWYVWHDSFGNIVASSKGESLDLDEQYSKAEFSSEQVSIIKTIVAGKEYWNWHLYKVISDKFDNSVKFLVLKENTVTKLDEHNLILVENIKSKDNDYSIKIKVNKKKVVVSMHNNLLKEYSTVGADNAVIKNRTSFYLYFTSKNDPSFLFYKLQINIFDLVKTGSLERRAPIDLTEYSIYTLDLFDTYVRV